MTMKMRSGITSTTSDNLFIGPGAIYKGFTDMDNLGTLLGATKGGNKITIKKDWHNAEIDGALGPLKGAKWMIGCEVEAETNLLELTLENIKLTLAGCLVDTTTSTTHNIVHQEGTISPGDYETFAIVGELVGKDEPIIFVVKDAIATDPYETSTGNGKDDVVLKLKLIGHYDPDNPTKLPYEIYYPKN